MSGLTDLERHIGEVFNVDEAMLETFRRAREARNENRKMWAKYIQDRAAETAEGLTQDDWFTNSYMIPRYGTWENAKAFWLGHGYW